MFSSVGSWTPGTTTITAGQMSAINANMQLAHDAIGGGTYTCVTQTEFNGTAGVLYNFSAVGIQIGGLGGLHILSGSSAYVDSGGFLTVSSGGVATISNGASLNLANGSEEVVQSGAALTVASGGELNVSSGGAITVAPGSTASFQEVVELSMSQPTPTADPGANNRLYSTNVPKAWAKITTDGAGGYAINDGYNVASCTVAATYVEVTWARAFLNAHYAPVVTAGIPLLPNAVNATIGYLDQTTTKTRIYFWDIVGAATLNPATNSVVFFMSVSGRQ